MAAIPQTLKAVASANSRPKLSKFAPQNIDRVMCYSELVSELTTMQKENSQLSVKEQVSALKDFYFDKVVELLKTLQKRIV